MNVGNCAIASASAIENVSLFKFTGSFGAAFNSVRFTARFNQPRINKEDIDFRAVTDPRPIAIDGNCISKKL